ncbi:MAG: anti-sigma factor antagonist [Chloroflexi bacterium]|nr:anti-sigma factor antagonist [Chloroflexota bacterium]
MRDERHLSFKARLENVPSAADFVVQSAQAAGLDDRAIYHCQLAVDEACTNIIEHGFGGDQADTHGQIHLITGIEEDDVFVITIADNSPAFNPVTYKDPDPTMPLEDRPGGGWGIYFIKKLMDAIDYRHADGKNHLTLRKNIQDAGQAHQSKAQDVISVTRQIRDKDYLQLNLAGQIDSQTSGQLESVLDEEISEHGNIRLIVSFQNVNYISSSGLKVLVSAWRKARQQGGDVLVTDLQSRIREVFEMIGFDMMFHIYDNPEAAIADNPIDRS